MSYWAIALEVMDYTSNWNEPKLESLLRRQPSGGYFQWVLDAACEAVERPNQPLGFDSLALRSALDQPIIHGSNLC
jgi:hypothetical protein